MIIRASRCTIVAAALSFALAAFIFGTPASAYDRVQVTNTTTFAAHIHVKYAACRSDEFTVAAGATKTAPTQRGACLVVSITATLTGGPAVRAFTSSGTSYSKFSIVRAAGQFAVEQK